jgi:nucleotide-binding universal stress UspA family protein
MKRGTPVALRSDGGFNMIDLKRILVPTDFGEPSAAALKYGLELAQRFGAELHLFHVVENPGEAAEAEYPIGLFDTMQNAAHDRLRQLLTPAELREVQPHCAMRLGAAADEIVRYAESSAIDLIVMGTHGREGVARAIMGSVAEKVVRRATCPVLTVHRSEREVVMAEEPVAVGFVAA